METQTLFTLKSWHWICLFFSEGGGGTADLAVFGGGSSALPENFPGEADEQGQKGECGWLGQQRAIFFMLTSAQLNFQDWHWNFHWAVTSRTQPKLWCYSHCSYCSCQFVLKVLKVFHAYLPQRDVPLYLYLLPANLSEDLYQMNSTVLAIVSGGVGLHVEKAVIPHRGSTGSDGTHALQLPGRCSTHGVILRVNYLVGVALRRWFWGTTIW